MRAWVKIAITAVVLVVLAFGALAGTGTYFFLRHLDTSTAAEADVHREFDAIRGRYAGRTPLVEIVNLQAADIRVRRAVHPQGRRAETLHVLTWDPESGERVRTDVPLWLMRFSSLNVLSRLGLTPERFSLTAEDIARYGPGIVIDFKPAGVAAVLIWVE